MAQPVWITPAGSLGTIPEGVFYSVPLQAYDPDSVDTIYYEVIAGELPAGIEVVPSSGLITGVPQTVLIVDGIPTAVSQDVTSKFAIRAYTTRVISGVTVVNRLADRTFTLTVTGQNNPEFVTPAGQIAQYFDGTQVADLQIEYTDVDPADTAIVKLAGGQLPPGLTITPTGLISGFIAPNTDAGVPAGFSRDGVGYDTQGFDYSTKSSTVNYSFVLELTDGKTSNLRTFSILVYSRNACTADAETIILGNSYNVLSFVGSGNSATITFPTQSSVPFSVGQLLIVSGITPSSLNSTYQVLSATNSSVSINCLSTETYVSGGTITVVTSSAVMSADNTFVTADCTPTRTPIILTPQGSIGTVRNDNFFAFKFDGLDLDGDQITYTISLAGTLGYDTATVNFTPGSYDYPGEGFDQGGFTLPPGLQLDPGTGWLYGFIPDLGITELTYNFAIRVYKTNDPTVISGYYFYSMNIVGNLSTQVTWLTDSYLGSINNGEVSTLYVKAVNASGIPLQYQLESGSTSSLPQGLQLLPEGDIAGRVSFDTFALDGGTTTFDVQSRNVYNPNIGPYTSLTTETTFDMVFKFTVNAYSVNGVVSVFKTFYIRVIRAYNEPYDNLYIQAMPPQNDRDLLDSLLQNVDIFPPQLLYRPQDPNFGLATQVKYWHAYGLTAATLDEYVAALNLNHYWKNLVLGSIETAQALDANGNVIYEVVYSRVVDNLVNNEGESVGKEVTLAYPLEDGTTTVYPNSLVDMRTQVIDSVGQISNVLPRWMISKQTNGQVLGFTPAWVIAYTLPGQSGQIAYNIKTIFGQRLNLVDFDVDRYELDNLLTKNWDRELQQWNPTPPELTTFDVNPGPPTVFDGNSIQFIIPVDMYSNTQAYDKYLVFPKRNILE